MHYLSDNDEEDLLQNPIKSLTFNFGRNVVGGLPLPSLEKLAEIRIITGLWERKDILDIIIDKYCLLSKKKLFFDPMQWLQLEKKVKKKLLQLCLPKSYHKSCKEYLMLVGNEIYQFLKFESRLERFTRFELQLYLENIRWTYHGKIDRTATITRLLHTRDMKSLSIIRKFSLMCNYCFEHRIRHIFNKMRWRLRRLHIKDFMPKYWIRKLIGGRWSFRDSYMYPLHPMWKGNLNFSNWASESIMNLDLNLEWAFDTVRRQGNEVAVQYIWENWAHRYVKCYVVEFCASEMRSGNIAMACYLMSRMNSKEERSFLAESDFEFIEMLLNNEWWFTMAMPMAKYICRVMWKFDSSYAKKATARYERMFGMKNWQIREFFTELLEYCESHT